MTTRPSIADEIIAEDCIFHTAPPELPRGPEGLKQWSALFFDAFTNIHLRAVDIIAEGSKVTARFTGQGMHTKKSFMGYEANGQEVKFAGVDVYYITDDNKIIEHWIYFDVSGLGTN